MCYVHIYLFNSIIQSFSRATTHDVAARNGANSKHNPNNDENHVRNRHPTTLLFSSTFSHVFIFHTMDSIVSALCKRFALFALFVLFALLTSAALFISKPRHWIKIKPRQPTLWNSHIRCSMCSLCSLCVCNS